MKKFDNQVDMSEDHSSAAVALATQLIQSISEKGNKIISQTHLGKKLSRVAIFAAQTEYGYLRGRDVLVVDEVQIFVPFVANNLNSQSKSIRLSCSPIHWIIVKKAAFCLTLPQVKHLTGMIMIYFRLYFSFYFL